jgi:hypothetical protein
MTEQLFCFVSIINFISIRKAPHHVYGESKTILWASATLDEDNKPQPFYTVDHEKMIMTQTICVLVICTLGCSLHLTVYYLLDTSQSFSFVLFAIQFPILSLVSLYITMKASQNYTLVKKALFWDYNFGTNTIVDQR